MALKKISKGTQKSISVAIDKIFEQLKARFLGPEYVKKGGKGLIFHFDPMKSLGGMVIQSAHSVNASHNPQVKNTLEDIAASYLDASKERFRAKIFQAIQSGIVAGTAMNDVKASVEKVLSEAHFEVKRILETETSTARNFATVEGIGKVAAARGVDDPVMFWVTIKDDVTCPTCKSLYLMPDGVTPRLWRQSELLHGYWKKGMTAPSVSPAHPSCRCTATLLLPGYSFNETGHVTYESPDHDELKKQRGI